MANNEIPEMPWGGILKRTVQVAGAVFLGLAGLAAAEIHRLKSEKAEAERPRWTDKNRWE